MRRRRSLATLGASLALHGGALLAVLSLASGGSDLGALFIDLTEWAEARMGAGAPSVPSRAPRASAGGARRLAAPPPPDAATSESGSAPAPPAPVDAPPLPRGEAPEPGPGAPAVAITPGSASPDASSPGVSPVSGALGPAGGGERVGARGDAPGRLGARGAGVGTTPDVSHGWALAAPGSGAPAPGAEYGPYLGKLRQRIQGSLKYPLAARRRGLAGTVSLEIVIEPDGTFGVVAVAGSSSHAILDQAALETVRGLPPEPLPPGVPTRILRVRLPVVFALE